MEERVNVSELLKDCPQGMELDCTMYDDCEFLDIDTTSDNYLIRIKTPCGIKYLDKYGCYTINPKAKCVIFPKGKTTWEGFVPPYQFKDGDIIFTHANNLWISIFKEKRNGGLATYVDCAEDGGDYYSDLDGDKPLLCMESDILRQRLATEEEKQKLFDAIKDNGYKWNANEKKLEKLIEPKFKLEKGKWYVCIKDLLDNYANKAFHEGDIYLSTQDGSLIPSNSNVPFEVACPSTYFRDWTIQDAKDGDVLCTYECNELKIIFILKGTLKKNHALSYHCYYNVMYPHFASDSEGCLALNDEDVKPSTKEQSDILFQKMKEAGYKWITETKTLEKLVEPKFKVGDRLIWLTNPLIEQDYYIKSIEKDRYVMSDDNFLLFTDQDGYEAIPNTQNKFDITTLKPFESRVLVRDREGDSWLPAIFGCIFKNNEYPFFTMEGGNYKQCIPYDKNKELNGTADDCSEYYKTWKNYETR